MERRVALLRAINVGGGGRLKMDALREAARAAGLHDATTHGASGNLLYASDATVHDDEAALATALEPLMGKPPTVVVRTIAELRDLVAADPFAAAPPEVPPKWRFTAFLHRSSDAPAPAVPDGTPIVLADRREREVCFWMTSADRKAIDYPKALAKALGVEVTVRNWNVVQALAEG